MSSSSSPSSANEAFQAFYLQRVTAELAEDLDQLRTAADFLVPGQPQPAETDASGKASAGRGAVSDTDNSLQMLIGALRQGADMFSAADQARVVGSGSGTGSGSGSGSSKNGKNDKNDKNESG